MASRSKTHIQSRWPQGSTLFTSWDVEQAATIVYCHCGLLLRQKFAKPGWQMTSQNKACCNCKRWSRSVDIYLSFRQNGYLSQRAISFWSIFSIISGEYLGIMHKTKLLKLVAESPWSEIRGTRDECDQDTEKGWGQSQSERLGREKTRIYMSVGMGFKEWESGEILKWFY